MEHRIPERRQRVRILTLMNFGKAAIAAVVLLLGVNFLSEARRTKHDDYGRLFGNEVPKTETLAPRPVQVVTEAAPAVEDHTAADPLLLEPAQREAQYLAVQQPVAAAQPDASRVAVSGDSSGVIVVNGPKHLLAGGFGR